MKDFFSMLEAKSIKILFLCDKSKKHIEQKLIDSEVNKV